MGKCNDCKHGKTSFDKGMNSIEGMTLLNSNPKSVLGDMCGICENGNQDTFVKWWKESGGRPSSENPDVPCYEPTDLHKSMDSMLGTLDKMLELIKKDK